MKKFIQTILIIAIFLIPIFLLVYYMDDIQSSIQRYQSQSHQTERYDNDNDDGSPVSRFLSGSRKTETFGEYQYAPFDGKHYGIDFRMPKDTPVKAAADGTVTRLFKDDLGGNVLQIAEDNGEYHEWYMHLNSYDVKVGDHVEQGDVIAHSGNTGKQTTGAHLHFQRMRGGVGNDYAVDPEKFVDNLPDGEKSLYDIS